MSAVPSPYDAPELYDLVLGHLDFDLAFWRAEARAANGPVLDVGCGTGRVLLALAAAGADVDGLDDSPAMIARLRAKAAEHGLAVRAEIADMRRFAMPRRYARALSAFNAFAHCDTTADQLAMLRCCREHLQPGGALVIHMSYPGPAYWAEADADPVLEIEIPGPGVGHTLQMWDTRAKDVVAQRQHSRIEIRELDAARAVVASHRFETAQRWVYRYELELLFAAAGYARWELFGGFAGEPLERPDQSIVARAWRD